MSAMKQQSGTTAWLLYACVRLVVAILRCFPVNWNMLTARLFARVWWTLMPRHLQRAREHLRLALGSDCPEKDLDRIARASLEHLAMFAIDFVFAPYLVNAFTWQRYVRLPDMASLLRILLDGRGAILITGHFGNWELAGYLLALFGFDVAAVMRPLDNVYLNRWVVEVRRRKGMQLLYKKGAMESAEDIIHRGGALGFIADQDAGPKGIFVDFFGRKASTYKSIGLLAMTTEAPIIVGFARRIGRRFEFEVGVERIIRPDEWRDRDDPLHWITQEYSAALESAIRRAPEQYLWIHRRWKHRPREERLALAAARTG
jgi:Kdo2-lipid IVA lauroyltransferase/acyltransferase